MSALRAEHRDYLLSRTYTPELIAKEEVSSEGFDVFIQMLSPEEKRLRTKAHYYANREKYLKKGAERRLLERETRRQKERIRYAALPEEIKRELTKKNEIKRQERKYGLSEEGREKLLAQQHGGCALCGKLDGSTRFTRLSTDHDHLTGEIRGLLCSSCNRGLGLLGDTEEVLLKALAYLRRKAWYVA